MLRQFNLVLLQDNGSRIYQVEGYNLVVEETKGINDEFYLLSTKEILNVLYATETIDKVRRIKINNTKLLNLQGYIQPATGFLNLYCVSCLTDGRFGINSARQQTLFTLLHEVAHIKGIIPEPEADKWALDNIATYWGSMISE